MKLSYTTKLFLKKSALIPILYTTILNQHVKSLEHIYPKSLCNKPHNKDIHNIYPTSYNLNFIRSNYNYSILNISDSDVININNNLISKKRQLFYPRKEDRGIVARAILYMNYNYNYNKFENLEMYLEWNNKYKPTFNEYIHNEFAYKIQGNRNIFIDQHIKNI